MIPFIRSLAELMVITKPIDKLEDRSGKKEKSESQDENNLNKDNINYKEKNTVVLPRIEKIKRKKWVKRKEAVSRFFDELEYNNQIPSSYDITLLENQNNYNQNDVA